MPPPNPTPHSGGGLKRRGILAAAFGALLPSAARAALATPFALSPLPDWPLLRPLGGFEIDRAMLGFGGLSGLHIAPDLTVTTISDLGRFAEFALTLGPELRPTGLALRRSGPLRDPAGRPLPRGHYRDAESLARLPDGAWLVGFERWPRIARYQSLDGPARYIAPPPGLAQAPANAGLETLAVLEDGRWLAMAEDLPLPEAPGATTAWLGRPGAWMRLGWRTGDRMHPVDATPLPGGDVLVLERAFSWIGGFWGRVVRLDRARIAAAQPGMVLEGTEILRIEPPLPMDNYEGIAAVRHAGRMVVGMVSDDNQSRFQRSLMLFFELAE